jgi:hypothetical protein
MLNRNLLLIDTSKKTSSEKILKLSKILPEYEDITEDFLKSMVYEYEEMFDVFKLEKDFLLTILLIYF